MKMWNISPLLALTAAAAIVLPGTALATGTHTAAGAGGGMAGMMLAEAQGSVVILSPKQGETVDGAGGIPLKYNVHLSPNGGHLHVYVDHRRPIIDHNVTGCPCTLKLPRLSAGKHRVAVKEATPNHHLTGVGSTVTFNVR